MVLSLFEMSRLLHSWKTNPASRFPLTIRLEEDDILKSCCQATVIDCLSSSEQKRHRMCRSKGIKIGMKNKVIKNIRNFYGFAYDYRRFYCFILLFTYHWAFVDVVQTHNRDMKQYFGRISLNKWRNIWNIKIIVWCYH